MKLEYLMEHTVDLQQPVRNAAVGPFGTRGLGAETLCADVLFTRFNNIKGAGVVALLNAGVGKNGLALVVSDAGNTDLLRLATVDGDPTKKGKLKILSSVPLKNGIAENVWYRLIMTVDPTTPRVTGQVFTHSMPLNPDSPLGVQVGSTLTYEEALPTEVSSPGQNGILAQAVSAVVDLSVTRTSATTPLAACPRRPEASDCVSAWRHKWQPDAVRGMVGPPRPLRLLGPFTLFPERVGARVANPQPEQNMAATLSGLAVSSASARGQADQGLEVGLR